MFRLRYRGPMQRNYYGPPRSFPRRWWPFNLPPTPLLCSIVSTRKRSFTFNPSLFFFTLGPFSNENLLGGSIIRKVEWKRRKDTEEVASGLREYDSVQRLSRPLTVSLFHRLPFPTLSLPGSSCILRGLRLTAFPGLISVARMTWISPICLKLPVATIQACCIA